MALLRIALTPEAKAARPARVNWLLTVPKSSSTRLRGTMNSRMPQIASITAESERFRASAAESFEAPSPATVSLLMMKTASALRTSECIFLLANTVLLCPS